MKAEVEFGVVLTDVAGSADGGTAPNAIDEAAHSESVGRRYIATVLAQGLQLIASLITAGVVPRMLGAATYGSYSFLLNMAATLRGFTEPSAQQAFLTFSSQERASGSLTRLYALWIVVQFGMILAIIALAAATGSAAWIWPGQRVGPVVAITVLDWTMFLALSLKQLGDSKGLTVKPQMIGAFASALSVAGVLALAVTGRLTFSTYVGLNLLTSTITVAALAYWLLVVQARWCWEGDALGDVAAHLRRWWAYARPLIVVEYYTPLIAALSTYLVQWWYGSVEQGQIALATRWSAVVLLFSSSAVTILWREIAAATASDDHERAGLIYRRFNRLLTFVAVVLCTWLSLASPTLVRALAGPEYIAAIPVVMVMAYYPLAQTIGQLSTAGLKAAGRTAEYRKWALLLSIPDLALTYLLIAPSKAPLPGLGLGAFGVAIKMTGFALVSVQVYEWALTRHFGRSYRQLAFGYATTIVLVVGACGGTMMVVSRMSSSFVGANAMVSLTVASGAYFLAALGLAIAAPALLGFSRSELAAAAARCLP